MHKNVRVSIVKTAHALLLSTIIPAIALAQEEHAHTPSIADLSWHLINFAIYLAILAYFIPGAFKTAWRARRQRIAAAVASSREVLERADARLNSARAQLTRSRADSDAIGIEIEKHAKLEAAKMVEDAHAKGVQIVARAKTLAAAERRAALSKVRRDVAEQVINQARQIISRNHNSQSDKPLRSAALSGVKQIVH